MTPTGCQGECTVPPVARAANAAWPCPGSWPTRSATSRTVKPGGREREHVGPAPMTASMVVKLLFRLTHRSRTERSGQGYTIQMR